MAGTTSLNFLYLTFIFTTSSVLGENKPFIESAFERIVDAGSNFTVVCWGNEPLNWTILTNSSHQPPEDYKSWTTITVTDEEPSSNQQFQYGKRLFIENITYPFTGYYTCHYERSGESNIYLFVRDEEHLSVTSKSSETIQAVQFSDVVIPCRPTSPDVEVELINLSVGTTYSDSISYDPKTGFTFFVSDLSYDGFYYCSFSRNGSEFDLTVILKVGQKIDVLPAPYLTEASGGHTIVGDQLILSCTVNTDVLLDFKWITPKGPVDKKRSTVDTNFTDSQRSGITHFLTINNTTLEDNGTYTCIVNDVQNHITEAKIDVQIYGKDDHFIELKEVTDSYVLSVQFGDRTEVQWAIEVKGHPEPTGLYWTNNRNELIPPGESTHYSVSFTPKQAVLNIKDITIADHGNYTLCVENKYENKTLSVFLNVTDKPTVQINIGEFYMVNNLSTVECIAYANPLPRVDWFYKSCEYCEFERIIAFRNENNPLRVNSFVRFKATQSGWIKCNAENYLGDDTAEERFTVSDVKNGFDIFGPTALANETIATGETIEMTCGASSFKYSNDTEWLHNSTVIENDKRHRIQRSYTDFSHRVTLIVPFAEFEDNGKYSCRVSERAGGMVFKNFTITVDHPSKPKLLYTNLNKDIEMNLPGPLKLYCLFSGLPKPKVTWFKNDQPMVFSKRIKSSNNNQNVSFFHTEVKDEATYTCEGRSRQSSVVRTAKLTFKNKPEVMDKWLIIIIFCLGVLVIIFFAFIVIKLRKERQLRRELKKLDLLNFEKGALENLNPELGIDDQAELLPYDKRWEFPIEKLKLGKQLGSGAFGVVMKGVARGLVPGEETTTVAVKMVKKNTDHTHIKALASELKIMVHLGKHLNVVNLLGACTKHVAKRELLVIVEYCRYGNLHNYLLRHRNNFINQVDTNGRINFNIGEEVLQRTYSCVSGRSDVPASPISQGASDMADYRLKDQNTEATLIPQSTSQGQDNEGVVLSNNSVQPDWRSNYRGDYKGEVKPICTRDLLAWAFQVARGMEYLASRKVLHGDLAARNILLADDNVVKICDFGLAKSMYKNDNYKKSGAGPLPVKWMAIESIRDRIFSTQSDVWSYGIVLWEFFSLARTPYPGMEADERLYNKLLEGYRMESPDYSPTYIYKLMEECWHTKPLLRPTFDQLAQRIGCLLQESVRKYYIDLNDPYLVMNTQRLEGGNDYLAMLSPPNFENLSSPHHYVNDPTAENPSGYLCMKSAGIFSPRSADDDVFKFDLPNNKKGKNLEGNGNELRPMLNDESDGETSLPSPSPNSIANPLYHIPPKVDNDKQNQLKTLNNYVNMPGNKNSLNKDKNPFIKVDEDTKDVHYVNSNSRDWESVMV